MAFRNNGQIVVDGLVLALDASTDRSYPGSGTTWYDLSGNGYNGTLQDSSMGTISSSLNVIAFDGSTNFVDCGNHSNFAFGNNDHTLSAWFYLTSYSTEYNYFISIGTASTGGQTSIGFKDDDTIFLSAYSSPIVSASIGDLRNEWVNAVMVYNGTTDIAKFYINGTYIGSKSITLNVISGNINLGAHTGDDSFPQGNMGQALIYNKALSAEEVLQNYNATKGRFF